MARLDLSAEKRTIRPLIPRAWTDSIGPGVIGVGHDQATTENETSNPAAVTVTEKLGSLHSQRLALRFKSAEYRIRLAVLELLIDDIFCVGRTPRAVVIDATSERAGAALLRDQLAGRCPVHFFISSEAATRGTQKTTRGTDALARYFQLFEDNCIALPCESDRESDGAPEGGGWLYADHRLAKNFKGRYLIEEDSAGNHGDTLISGALSMLACTSSGEVRVEAAGPGSAERPGMLDDLGISALSEALQRGAPVHF